MKDASATAGPRCNGCDAVDLARQSGNSRARSRVGEQALPAATRHPAGVWRLLGITFRRSALDLVAFRFKPVLRGACWPPSGLRQSEDWARPPLARDRIFACP